MAILSSKTKRILEVALANRSAKNEMLGAIGSHAIAMCKEATSTSQTVDFADVKAGDILIQIEAAGTVLFDVVVDDGEAPNAAVVGDLYIAIRAV
jgi:hypothetical protein